MSEDLVIQYCSPTLAGLKTGSLFSCPCPSEEEVRRDVRALNQVLVPKGLCVLPLRRAGSRALIYLYRPDQLRRDLSRKSARPAGADGVRLPQCRAVPGGADPAAAATGGVSP